MPDCVAWGVEQVEAAVAVEVERAEFPNAQTVAFALEVDLAQVAVLPCALVDGGVGDCREGWYEGLLEAWADYEVG